MKLARIIWGGIVRFVIWGTVFLLPRRFCQGDEFDPKDLQPGEFRVTRMTFLGPAALLVTGAFLLAPYAKATQGWWIAKSAGLVAIGLGLAASYIFAKSKVVFAGETVTYIEGQQRVTAKLETITNVYSTPGFIKVVFRDGRRLQIPKLFHKGAKLLAMLREFRPQP